MPHVLGLLLHVVDGFSIASLRSSPITRAVSPVGAVTHDQIVDAVVQLTDDFQRAQIEVGVNHDALALEDLLKLLGLVAAQAVEVEVAASAQRIAVPISSPACTARRRSERGPSSNSRLRRTSRCSAKNSGRESGPRQRRFFGQRVFRPAVFLSVVLEHAERHAAADVVRGARLMKAVSDVVSTCVTWPCFDVGQQNLGALRVENPALLAESLGLAGDVLFLGA